MHADSDRHINKYGLHNIRVGFSDCGTFAYLRSPNYSIQKLNETQLAPNIRRYSARRSNLLYENALYIFDKSHEDGLDLETVFYSDLKLHDISVKYLQWIDIKDVYFLPHSLKDRSPDYLLGIHEKSPMRLLFLPSNNHPHIEIKTLQLTFDELSARLQSLWDEKYGTKESLDWIEESSKESSEEVSNEASDYGISHNAALSELE